VALEHFKTQVLLLHSQQSTLDALSAGFGDRYSVHLATSGAEALHTLGETPIHVIVSAQDLPGMSGLEALREARKRSPDTIGILLAGNDRDDGLEALVGDKEVFQIVRGAITPEALRNLIDTATKRARLLAISESANDQAADVDEPAGEHIVMETGEHGRPIISASAIPVLTPQKPQAAPTASGRETDVLVLTKDEEFLETIRQSSRGLHNVHHAPTFAQAEAAVRQHKIGVLVTDAAMAESGVENMTERLRAAVPRLVAVVAGRRDDGEMLMDLINRGQVYRFLLKPVSPGRARLAIEAAVKHHLEGPESAFTGKGRGAPGKAPPRPAAKGAPAPAAGRRTRAPSPPRGAAEPSLKDSGRLTRSGRHTAPGAEPAEAAAAAQAAPAERKGGRSLAIGVAAVVLLLAGAGAWMWLGSSPEDEPQAARSAPESAPSATSAPSVVETDIPVGAAPGAPAWQSVLEEARMARDAGELIAPPGNNAIELYLSARRMAPGDAVLASELEAVINQVLGLAETALLEDRAGDAADALAKVRLANPDHPRLPFLEAQVRERVLRVRLGEARLAIREGRFEDAAGALGAARALGGETPELALLEEELATARSEQQVDQVLARAHERLAQNRLIAPSNDNARYYYELVLSSDPGNTAARQGLITVASKLVLRARTAVDEGRLDDAEGLLLDARELDPASGELAGALEALAAARAAEAEARRQAELAAQEAAAREAAAEAAAAAATQAPASESPAAGEISADSEAAAAGASAFVPAAGSDVAPGADADETAPAAAAASGTGAAASTAPEPPEYVPISSLTRINYVVPEYPRTAQRRNITGWVDVSFTVTPEGTVQDVGILDSSPREVFDEAAIEAIERWRFEPPTENGLPVSRRVAVRLSFDLQ